MFEFQRCLIQSNIRLEFFLKFQTAFHTGLVMHLFFFFLVIIHMISLLMVYRILKVRGWECTQHTTFTMCLLNHTLQQNIAVSAGRLNFFTHDTKTMKTCFKTFVSQYSYNETNFSVKRNGERLLRWKHREPMLFYWFSLGAEQGEITWSANCSPEGEFKSNCILTVILKVWPKNIIFKFCSWRWVQET